GGSAGGRWGWEGQRRLADEPTLATRIGDRRYNDRWEDRSLEAIAARRAHSQDVLARIRAIDRAQLSPAAQLNYDLFLRNASSRVEEERFHGEYLPINTRYGPYSEIAEV